VAVGLYGENALFRLPLVRTSVLLAAGDIDGVVEGVVDDVDSSSSDGDLIRSKNQSLLHICS
jgi:hypothetical protein